MIRWFLSLLVSVGLLATAGWAPAEDKVFYRAGFGGKSAYAFSPSDVKIDGDMRQARIYSAMLLSPESEAKPYVVLDNAYDCSRRVMRVTRIEGLDVNFKSLFSHDNPTDWLTPGKGEPAAQVMEIICRYPEGLTEADRLEGDLKTVLKGLANDVRTGARPA